MERPYRDPEWLEARYHGDGLTQRAIAERCGAHVRTIARWMKRLGIETREVAGENHGLYGTERDEETKRKISETMQGREFSAETRRRISDGQRGRELPDEVREKISDSLSGVRKSDETRIKMSRSTAGSQNPNYRDGTFSEKWYGPLWTVVRDKIRARDEVCQHCGEDGTETGLDVHHIVPVRNFRRAEGAQVEEAHQEANLVLLCKRCHGKADHGLIDVGTPDWEALPDSVQRLTER